MKIAMIGAGNVGSTLGTCWAQSGHEITFGVRDPQSFKVKALLAGLGKTAKAFAVADAVALADVVVLTTPWEGTQDAIRNAGDLAGKVVIDVTNPILTGEAGLKRGLVVGHETSGAEQVAAWAPSARVVKAFNTTGAPNMANPVYNGTAASMFYCGDDAGAKKVVKQLGEELGFEMIDGGPLKNARLLEPLAMLWIDLAIFQGNGVNFALKMLKRE